MNISDRMNKIEARWCVNCKHRDIAKISKYRKENKCKYYVMMKSAAFMGNKMPPEIDLHKCICRMFWA